MPEPILQVQDLHVSYGAIKALRGCSLHVDQGETVAVVGANGAGKTTMLRAVSNLLPRTSGDILFEGKSTRAIGTHVLAFRGLFHVPEGRGTLGRLTVRENLRVAYDVRPSSETFAAATARVCERFSRVGERIDQTASNLSGGEQQMLALARAVINAPRVLLVDEPSLGLSPRIANEVFAMLRELQDGGMTILLVEQNVRKALAFAHRAYVLRQGEIAMSGTGQELLEKRDILDHYIGAT